MLLSLQNHLIRLLPYHFQVTSLNIFTTLIMQHLILFFSRKTKILLVLQITCYLPVARPFWNPFVATFLILLWGVRITFQTS